VGPSCARWGKPRVSKVGPGCARSGKARVGKVGPGYARSGWIWHIYTGNFIMGIEFSYYLYIYYYHLLRLFILGSLLFHVIAFRQASQNVHKNIILFTREYYIIF
jgi:hypothetical protein